EGTRWMTQILRKLEAGDASEYELDLLLTVCDRINGKCLCPLGETAATAVASYVAKFREEYVAHLEGGCPFGDQSPLDHVMAPVAQHHHSPTAVEVPVG
ncbi:MAG: NADH-quinone oxidoreductase subunit, partial [Gaiellaceae bacterium]|nr:NADH-quinone oxidoreductase subunit [Gaiellaceae bacterium]